MNPIISRLLCSRLAWEVVVGAVLILAIVSMSRHALTLKRQIQAAKVDQTLTEVNARLEAKTHAYSIIQKDLDAALQTQKAWAKTFEQLQQQRPQVKTVRVYVESKTTTDAGLLAEARRVLGTPGESVRVATTCQ